MRVRKTLSTVARMGRSMKRCVKRIVPLRYPALPAGSGLIEPSTGATLHPGRTRTRPSMTTRSSAARPLWTIAQPIVQTAGLDHFRNDRAIRGHGHHDLPRLVGDDGRRRHQQGRCGLAEGDAKACELPRRDGEVRIRHRRARVDRPAAPVHRIVDEVERAVAVEMAVAVKAYGDVGARRGAVTGLLIRKVIGLAHVEIQVDRVERDDRRH